MCQLSMEKIEIAAGGNFVIGRLFNFEWLQKITGCKPLERLDLLLI